MRTGRPIAITHREIFLLERALKNGTSIAEACRYAGIGRTTYYAEYARNEGFAVTMERAKDWLVIQARHTIASALTDRRNVKVAAWFLERRDPAFRK